MVFTLDEYNRANVIKKIGQFSFFNEIISKIKKTSNTQRCHNLDAEGNCSKNIYIMDALLLLLLMKTYKVKILRCSKLIRDKAIGQPCGSTCFDQIGFSINQIWFSTCFDQMWFSLNPGAINRLAAQIAKELGETEAKLKWVRAFIITNESSLDVVKKWLKFDKQWIIIINYWQKYIRYKSLCLGLLGQLKKMHIQLPMLYVVKVLASSPHNFVLLLKLGVPISASLCTRQAG